VKVCGDQSLAFRTADFRSSRLRHWLALQYLDDHEAAPGKNAMDECLNAVEARAVAQGKRYTAFIRVAEHDGRVFLDPDHG